MPTPNDLAATYSFIGPFLADSVLFPYGDNALPLFALGLYLGIEDLASFATDSLTDQPNDKKADVIYINEAEGVACVAQGYTAQDWGKQEAPASKASDLNAAAAWLLQAPLGDVPETIRSHAKLLRDGLAQKTISRVVFAYAHNAMESPNVDAELQTLRHSVSGLDIVKDVEVSVVELGMRQIEALHLTSLGSIQVTDEVEFRAAEMISETGTGWQAYIIPISGSILHELYEKYQNALFSANLRDFLGARRVSGNVNNQIKSTVESKPGLFFVLNNGITLVTKKAERTGEGLRVHGLSIVNGAQTTGAIHSAGNENAQNISVLGRVIVVDDPALIPTIVSGNNTQNSIVAWDRRSNDPVQVRIGQEFASKEVEYVHRRDNTRKSATSLFAEQVGQLLCAFGGDLQTAIRAKAEIFESDSTYASVFPVGIAIGHIFAIQTLAWAYDRVKQELKSKVVDGSATDIEQRELRLIDYPASKQFLVRVVGELREQIAGRAVSSPDAFQLAENHIVPSGEPAIDAWAKVLRAILPVLVQNLPAEEYQVVRSTEHTATVAGLAQGIVAGAEALQAGFSDLRTLLNWG